MNGHKPRARVKSVKLIHDGFLKLRSYELEVERHQGGIQSFSREVMERGHAVAALGYDPTRDEVVLVNECRPGILAAGEYPFTDNLAAGGIAKDETPIEAAVREMLEETGIELRDPVVIHPGAYVSSGGTSEKISIVFGIVDTSAAGGVHGNPDEQEDILVVVLPAQEFIERTRRGEITDLKTLVAGYWLSDYREARDIGTPTSRTR